VQTRALIDYHGRRRFTQKGDSQETVASHGQQELVKAGGARPQHACPHRWSLRAVRRGIELRICQQGHLDAKGWCATAYDLVPRERQDPRQRRCHRQPAGEQAQTLGVHCSLRANPFRNCSCPRAIWLAPAGDNFMFTPAHYVPYVSPVRRFAAKSRT